MRRFKIHVARKLREPLRDRVSFRKGSGSARAVPDFIEDHADFIVRVGQQRLRLKSAVCYYSRNRELTPFAFAFPLFFFFFFFFYSFLVSSPSRAINTLIKDEDASRESTFNIRVRAFSPRR